MKHVHGSNTMVLVLKYLTMNLNASEIGAETMVRALSPLYSLVPYPPHRTHSVCSALNPIPDWGGASSCASCSLIQVLPITSMLLTTPEDAKPHPYRYVLPRHDNHMHVGMIQSQLATPLTKISGP